jgi:hypothetical protein
MKKHLLLIAGMLLCLGSFAQFRLGVFGGISNYMGDLEDKYYVNSRGTFGITGTFPLTQRLNIRAGLTIAKVVGADSLSNQADLTARNLSFQSRISELSVLAEYNFFNLDQIRWTPYVFGGLAVFRFNPYTFDQQGVQVFLQPLGTEGQGIPGYQGRYSRTQMAVPIGGGVKFALSESIQLGLELGIRKLFTDYLDDVSGNYADPAELLSGNGQQAVDLSYRGDELPGGDQNYPAKGFTRGSSRFNDYYYFTGLHLSFRLGQAKDRSGYGCPKNF